MQEGIFMSEQNQISNRCAIFEDNGISGWLYLTNANESNPIGDCWIYNRITAPNPSEINNYRNGPPPASVDYAGPNSLVIEPEKSGIVFKWSADGNSIALLMDTVPLGFIDVNFKGGFSMNLLKNGPWGNVFDQDRYRKLFVQIS